MNIKNKKLFMEENEMKHAIVKVDVIIKVDGTNMSLTTHIKKDESFVLNTEKYPNAELVSIKFTEVTLIF